MHYYINPKTGRTIKEKGQIFKQLKSERYKIEKDPCFYNETSAKRCLKRLTHYYPNIHLPNVTVSNNVTVIRNKEGKVHGVLSNKGDLYKLQEPLDIENNIPELKTVSEKHQEILDSKLEKAKVINLSKNKLQNAKGDHIVYNPLYDNYISGDVNKKTLDEKRADRKERIKKDQEEKQKQEEKYINNKNDKILENKTENKIKKINVEKTQDHNRFSTLIKK